MLEITKAALAGALARIDAGITKYLTPKRANEVPPRYRARIFRFSA